MAGGSYLVEGGGSFRKQGWTRIVHCNRLGTGRLWECFGFDQCVCARHGGSGANVTGTGLFCCGVPLVCVVVVAAAEGWREAGVWPYKTPG